MTARPATSCAVTPSLFTGADIKNWTFGDLRPFDYDFILADPAWEFALRSKKGEGKSAQAHYKCMSLEEIKALPVGELANENAFLFLWATAPMLPQAIDTMAAWGFEFKSAGFWHKKTKYGKSAFGTGYRLRSAAEPFLIGTRGNPKNFKTHRNVIEAKVREHSRKPEETYGWIDSYIPWPKAFKPRRCELFARTERDGWDVWGNETNLFDGKFSEAET